jgi:K+ transporter
VLQRCGEHDLHFNMMDKSSFVGQVMIVPGRNSRIGTIRCKLFEAMHRNALAATRVVRLGGQVEL